MPTVEDFMYKDTRKLVDKLRNELDSVVDQVKGPLKGLSKNTKKFEQVYSNLSDSIKTTSDNLNQAIDKTTETLLQKEGLLNLDFKTLNENIGATQGLTVVLEKQLQDRTDLNKEEQKALRAQIAASKGYIKQVTGFSTATKGLTAAVKAQIVENFGPEEIIGKLDNIPIVGSFLKGVGLDLLRQRKARKDAAKEAIAQATRNKLKEDRDNVKLSKAKNEQAEAIERETESIQSGDVETVSGDGIVSISDDSIQLMTDMLTIGFKDALKESQPKKDDPSKLKENRIKKRQENKKELRNQKVDRQGKGGGLGLLGVGAAATGIAGAVTTLTAALTAAGVATPGILAGGAALGGGIGAIIAGIGIGAAVGGAAVSGAIYLIGEAIDSIANPLKNLKSAIQEYEDLDGEKITQAADGMAALAGPLAKNSLAGLLANFVGENGIENLKGLATSIKEYENLDGSKLEEVALGLAAMEEPLKDTTVAGIIANFADPTVLGALADSVKRYENLDPTKLGETADAMAKFGPALNDFAGETALASFKGFVGGLADFLTIGDDPIEKMKKFGDIADPLNETTEAIEKFEPVFDRFFKLIEGKSFEGVGDSFKSFAISFKQGLNNVANGMNSFRNIGEDKLNSVSGLIESVANLTRAQTISNLSMENADMRSFASLPGGSNVTSSIVTQNNNQGVVISKSVDNDNLDSKIVAYSYP